MTNFKEIQAEIKVIEMIINAQLVLEDVGHVEDIADRQVRDLMLYKNLLKKSICGSETSETQQYWYDKAQNIYNEFNLK